MWNIEKIISKGEYNYALVKDHPKATKNGYVLEHRVVMENHLGRILNDDEVVHHKDGNKKNNSIDNLIVLSNKEHSALHQTMRGRWYVSLKCPVCNKVFEREKRNTHLSKNSKYGCTCCCRRCRGIMLRKIQLNGLTHSMESAISENILSIYRKFIVEDNSEETTL